MNKIVDYSRRKVSYKKMMNIEGKISYHFYKLTFLISIIERKRYVHNAMNEFLSLN